MTIICFSVRMVVGVEKPDSVKVRQFREKNDYKSYQIDDEVGRIVFGVKAAQNEPK